MPLPIDTSKVSFLAGNDPNPVKVHNSEEQRVRDGKPIFDTQIVALPDEGEAEIMKVRMAGAPVGLKRHQPVKVTGLEVRTWEMEGKKGLTYWATAIESAHSTGRQS